jgi:hypothetical protein
VRRDRCLVERGHVKALTTSGRCRRHRRSEDEPLSYGLAPSHRNQLHDVSKRLNDSQRQELYGSHHTRPRVTTSQVEWIDADLKAAPPNEEGLIGYNPLSRFIGSGGGDNVG